MDREMELLLKEGAGEFGVNLDDGKIAALSRFMGILLDWNRKLNLTAIEEEREFVVKHFIDSLSVMPNLQNVKNLIDVGTGAGFPGIPLKIAEPRLQVVLLDSLEKKVNFLNAVICELGLSGIKAVQMRAEDAGRTPQYRETLDAAVARAVAPMPVLLEYCLPLVKTGGAFLAMKGICEDEIEISGRALDILGGKIEECRKFVLPGGGSYKRCVIVVKKLRQTPTKYPRKAGKPSKEPLV